MVAMVSFKKQTINKRFLLYIEPFIPWLLVKLSMFCFLTLLPGKTDYTWWLSLVLLLESPRFAWQIPCWWWFIPTSSWLNYIFFFWFNQPIFVFWLYKSPSWLNNHYSTVSSAMFSRLNSAPTLPVSGPSAKRPTVSVVPRRRFSDGVHKECW